MPNKKMLVIHPKDNVGVVLEDVQKGDLCVFQDLSVTAEEAIPFPHKIALYDLEAETPVIKYGEVIGHATGNIPRGSLIHTHNMGCRRGTHDEEGKV